MWYKYKENKSLYGRRHFCCRVIHSASPNSVYSQNPEWDRPKRGSPLLNAARKLEDFTLFNLWECCTRHLEHTIRKDFVKDFLLPFLFLLLRLPLCLLINILHIL